MAQTLFQEREQIFHQFEVRQIIESQAARLAALRRSETDLGRLREFNRQFEADLRQEVAALKRTPSFILPSSKPPKIPC
ncbi:MAG: FCD domain-containing protein [Anaerolineae bacterium]